MQIRFASRSARTALAAALAFSTAAATGADFSVGAGLGGADGRVDCVGSFPCDRSGASWKVFAGWRLSEAVELQALAFGAGRFEGGDTTSLGTEFGGRFKVRGLGLSAGYRWFFAPRWSLVGRAGIASVHTRFQYADSRTGDASKTSVQPLLGIGLGWQLAPAVAVGLDYDLTRLRVHDTHGALHMLGVAAQYSF